MRIALHSLSMNLLFVWYPQSLSHQCCLWLWEAFYKLSRWMARLRSKQGSLKTDHTWNEPSASHFVSSVWLTHACFFPMTPSTLAGPQPLATWLHWHKRRTPAFSPFFFNNFCTLVLFLISPQYFTLWLTRNSEGDPFQVFYNYMLILESLNETKEKSEKNGQSETPLYKRESKGMIGCKIYPMPLYLLKIFDMFDSSLHNSTFSFMMSK